MKRSGFKVELRTRFGFPWRSTEGDTALWFGDQVVAIRKDGSHYFCRVIYGHVDYPKTMQGWIHKRQLRFLQDLAK